MRTKWKTHYQVDHLTISGPYYANLCKYQHKLSDTTTDPGEVTCERCLDKLGLLQKYRREQAAKEVHDG